MADARDDYIDLLFAKFHRERQAGSGHQAPAPPSAAPKLKTSVASTNLLAAASALDLEFEQVRNAAIARQAAARRALAAAPADRQQRKHNGDAAATMILEAYRTTVPAAAECGAEMASVDQQQDEAAVAMILAAFKNQ